jgi:hypothetical protein
LRQGVDPLAHINGFDGQEQVLRLEHVSGPGRHRRVARIGKPPCSPPAGKP